MTKKFKRVKRASLGENIAQQLLTLISTGDLKPAQRLAAERGVGKYFGVDFFYQKHSAL